jgi:hypothetical protein
LAKQGITILCHPPYTPDLVPADFFLFPELKIMVKGTRLKVVLLIQLAVMRELKAIQEDSFSQEFNLLYEQCKRCAEAGRDCIEWFLVIWVG